MKRLHTLLTMVAIAALSFTFTSCDENEDIAYTLDGTWEGNIYVSHKWDGRYYDASYSYIYFDRNPYKYAKGTGYWVDEYRDAPWGSYIANHISWKVRNRDIVVYFEEDECEIIIRNYELSDNYFDGYIYTYDNKKVTFHLRKTTSRNWNSYYYGWNHWGNYYWDDYYYYGKQNSIVEEETRATPSSNVEKPQRVFRLRE